MDTITERYCTPKESLEKACIQMNLMRESKLAPRKDWRAIFDDLENEDNEKENK